MHFSKETRFKHHIQKDLFDAQKLPKFTPDEDINDQISIIQREIAASDRLMVNRALDQERVKDSLKTIDNEVLRLEKLRKKLFPDSPPRTLQSRKTPFQSTRKEFETPAKTSWKEQHNVTMTQNLHRELVASSQSNYAIGRILKKLFTFYVSFGDRLNTSFIRTAQVYRILEDSNVLSREIDQRDVEILFYKHSNNQANIDFENFLDLMIDVAELKFPQDKDEQALIKLFEKHLRPLYASIYMNTEVGEFDTIFKEPIEKNVLLLLSNVEHTLRNIYKRSFPLEFFRGNLEEYGLRAYIQKSDNSCFTFLKDFNISPGLVSKSLANSLYQTIIDTPLEELTHNPSLPNVLLDPKSDLGRRFTFSRFLVFLARLAMIAHSSKNAGRTSSEFGEGLKPVHCLLLLFERMEFSKGYVEYEKSLHSTHNSSHRILPTKAFIERLLNNEIDETNSRSGSGGMTARSSPSEGNSPDRFYTNSLSPSPEKKSAFKDQAGRKKSVFGMQPVRKQSPTQKTERKRQKEVDPRVKLRPEAKAVLESKQNFIRKIFKHFSVFNSKINKYCLPSLKFLTILKQSNLLQEGAGKGADPKRSLDKKKGGPATNGLSSIDIDIIVSQVCGHLKKEEPHHLPEGSPTKLVKQASYFMPVVKQRAEVPETKEPATSKKLEYEQFLKIIELIAEKLYPGLQLNAAVETVISQHLMKIKLIQADASTQLAESLKTLEDFIALVSTPDMAEILKRFQESLKPYYKAYADPQGQINLEGFIRFAKDYCIFPDIITKEKAIQIFNHFAMVHPVMKAKRDPDSSGPEKSQIDPAELVHNEFVDESTFIAALMICAVQVQKEEGVEKHPIEKIAYMLDTMSNSPGPRAFHNTIEPARLSPLSYFDVLGFIRHKYRGLLGLDSSPPRSVKKLERVRRIFSSRSPSPKKEVFSVGQLTQGTPSPQRDYYT